LKGLLLASLLRVYSRLVHNNGQSNPNQPKGHFTGDFRRVWCASSPVQSAGLLMMFNDLGGFLFGYDIGVISVSFIFISCLSSFSGSVGMFDHGRLCTTIWGTRWERGFLPVPCPTIDYYLSTVCWVCYTSPLCQPITVLTPAW
jgi:hypothetical protein